MIKKINDLAKQMGMGMNQISLTKTLNFNEIVFVIEDIDAIGNIVHEREENEGPVEQEKELGGQEEANDKLDRLGDTLNMLTRNLMPPSSFMQKNGIPLPLNCMPGIPMNSIQMNIKNKETKNIDKLNLAGILNAIDGIVDAPGRIIIITSNFPEKLDKALIRPGRIDKIIKLDYIKEDQAIEMCKHFFEDKEVELNEILIRNIVKNNNITPAQIEQYALEVCNVEQFIDILENLKIKKESA
jgi:chaperone BCS1